MDKIKLSEAKKSILEIKTNGYNETDYNKIVDFFLICRYYYYIKSKSLISDMEYDMLENRLTYLVEDGIIPSDKIRKDCPSQTVGSSNIKDYKYVIERYNL